MHGSIPKSYDKELKTNRNRALDLAKAESLKYPPQLGGQYLEAEVFKINALFEMGLDKYLHKDSNGPYHLSNPDVAAEVLKSYQFFHDKKQLYVYAVCVMSNHVHAVVRAPDGLDEVAPGLIMSRHKGFTSRNCKEILGLSDGPFWEDDYFDRRVRDGKFNTVMWYVLNNPVKAGLVDNWREWPNTWLNPEYKLLF